MSDSVALILNGKRLEKFSSYTIDSDLYLAADAFQVDAAGLLLVDAGARVKVMINDQVELDGIVDAPEETIDKSGASLKLEGRDLGGLLADAHASDFGDPGKITLKALTERLIKPLTYINRNSIIYEDRAADINLECVYVEPGKPIFEVLAEKAKKNGLIFYARPDGKFVYGRPKTSGAAPFHITMRKDGAGNNAFFTNRRRDISRRFSEINVISNFPGTDANGAVPGASARYVDATFPKGFCKPMWAVDNGGTKAPAAYARSLVEIQQRLGYRLTYRVAGHAQNGRNWAVNEFCYVEDEQLDLKQKFLIYARKFVLNKEDGAHTEIQLGLPGLL